MLESGLDDRSYLFQRRSIGRLTLGRATYVRVVRIVVQVRVMRGIVSALDEGVIDVEPVIAVGIQ